VAGDVRQHLPHHRGRVLRAAIVGERVDRALEAELGRVAEGARRLGRDVQHLTAQAAAAGAGGSELEDRRADASHRAVELVDGLLDPCGHIRVVDEPYRPLEGEAGGEQALDHVVVQIASDAVALLDEDEVRQPRVQAGVLDRDAGGGGQRHDERLVAVGERPAAPLLGQVEVPEDGSSHLDGNAEERPHRRMVGWEARRRRVLREVVEAQHPVLGDQQAEDAVALGQVPDPGDGVGRHAGVQEPGQGRAGLVDHAEGGVLGIGQTGGDLHDLLQHGVEVQLGGDEQDGVQQALVGSGLVHRRSMPAGSKVPVAKGTPAGPPSGGRADAARRRSERHEGPRRSP
jgi:hypothetical protein